MSYFLRARAGGGGLSSTLTGQFSAFADASALVAADRLLVEKNSDGLIYELPYSVLLTQLAAGIPVNRLLATYTVAGAAKQTINFGAGGDAFTSGTFPTGKRYGVRMRVLPTTVANTHSFDIRPNSLTTNMSSQNHGASNVTPSASRTATGNCAGTSADVEEFIIDIQWDELAGFDRFFVIASDAVDASSPLTEYTWQYRVAWAQTPAEDVLDNFVVNCSQADGFGIGSFAALYELGNCA